ncbi:transposase [Actinomadura fulvescens]|uniref:Transposase n=1 Tax=Actinomadura fulvescens TaxID=46160 RepID=A0ABN3Q5R4_9ACTN
MGARWVGPQGWDVEHIVLQGRPCLRARRHGYLQGYCYSVDELTRLLGQSGLTLDYLVEVLPFRRAG